MFQPQVIRIHFRSRFNVIVVVKLRWNTNDFGLCQPMMRRMKIGSNATMTRIRWTRDDNKTMNQDMNMNMNMNMTNTPNIHDIPFVYTKQFRMIWLWRFMFKIFHRSKLKDFLSKINDFYQLVPKFIFLISKRMSKRRMRHSFATIPSKFEHFSCVWMEN